MTKTEQQLDWIYKQCGSPVQNGRNPGRIEIGLGHVLTLLTMKFGKLEIIDFYDYVDSERGYLGVSANECVSFLFSDFYWEMSVELLRDQSPETIEAIAKLMGWVDGT